ncbi:SseB family protein [Chitinophaga caseinilytica]|uniref:SseB family protein n=1 Tax=Chitinophaga caseinilytica TaxID=2267521 RepID=UPI003C2DE101
MGIFDIFKKQKPESTFPENELERCLMQAETDPTARKEFYQKLLWNRLFVLVPLEAGAMASEESSETETIVRFITFDDGQIPVFTSANRIFDKGIVKEEVSYVYLDGKDLFETAKGATFILNPFSYYGTTLAPDEIESIMNGSIYDQIDAFEREKTQVEAFNTLFERAKKKQQGLIILAGNHAKKLEAAETQQLEASVTDFKKCLEIAPDHWQSMVLMAKSLQRLDRHVEALEQLETAFSIESDSHTIPMEATLEALYLDQLDKALYYSAAAMQRKPGDYILMGNHALNLLLAQKDDEASSLIVKAIGLQPDDPVNRNIEAIVRDVLAGKRARPTFKELMHEGA